MPQALAIPWDKVKEEYVSKTAPVDTIAEKYGLKPDTIYKRASRQGWITAKELARKAARHVAKTAVKQHVAEVLASAKPELDSAIKEWVGKSKEVAAKLVSRVSEQLDQPQSPEDLQRLAGALDRGDGVGRRSLGMDKAENALGSNRVLLSIAAVGVIGQDGNLACLPVDYGQAGDAQPIEAEVISEGESFLGGETQPSDPAQESFSEPTTPGLVG